MISGRAAREQVGSYPRRRPATLPGEQGRGTSVRHATGPWRHVLKNSGADQRMKELKRPRSGEDLRCRKPIRGQLRGRRIEIGQ
jgi:hypothetical protein